MPDEIKFGEQSAPVLLLSGYTITDYEATLLLLALRYVPNEEAARRGDQEQIHFAVSAQDALALSGALKRWAERLQNQPTLERPS